MAGRKKKSSDSENQGEISVIEKKSVSTIEPKLYKVLLLNDDYSSMDFVVSVLENIFKKSPAEAVEVMLAVHKQGSGLAGVYPKEIAETKVQAVHSQARNAGYPLRCAIEEK